MKLNYPGVPVYMNGKNFFIPSLSVRDFRNNQELLTSPPEAGTPAVEIFDRLIPVILLAINRNYPDVTKEDLEEWLDLHTFNVAMEVVQAVSGGARATEGE